VDLLYIIPEELSGLQLNTAGDRFVFSQKVGGNADGDGEVFTVGTDGRDSQRLTVNPIMDTYPVWSPDGSRIAFLSWPDSTLDIFIMDADGSHVRLLYDSGFNDVDIHWVGNSIAFTRNSRIWIINDDGSEARMLTDPPRAEEWGNANLPFGDYDPRISPDGSRVVFERLVNDPSPQGNYDLYLIDIDGSNLARLTNTGFAQGLANWSHSGNRIAYIVAAIEGVGKFDIYTIHSDGRIIETSRRLFSLRNFYVTEQPSRAMMLLSILSVNGGRRNNRMFRPTPDTAHPVPQLKERDEGRPCGKRIASSEYDISPSERPDSGRYPRDRAFRRIWIRHITAGSMAAGNLHWAV
jgi:Tol biopolymer transport system component